MYPDDLFREFDQMFADLSLPLTSHARRGSFNPNADVYVTGGASVIVVQVELAGVDRENIKLVVEGTTLYMAGMRVNEAHGCEEVLQKEIEYGYFFKKVPLPSSVDVERARADYHGGVLTIKLPVAVRAGSLSSDRTEIRMVVRSRS